MNTRVKTIAITFAAAVVLLSPGLLEGHPDDPKERDAQPRYEGPGFRRDVDGPLSPLLGFPSENVQLESWLTLAELGNSGRGNDCWGYVSGSGREYAIIGTDTGTAFVEVTNPGNAQVVAFLSGPNSTWRDIKTYQTYAYAVSEGGSGIQVFDLSNIDSGSVTLANTVTNEGGASPTTKSHNIAINTETGYLYRIGGNSNGLRIFSLANPVTPTYVAEYGERYVHDAQIVVMDSGPFAGREIAFCCGGFNGGWAQTGLTIIDVTNKSNLVVLDHYEYPNGEYSHQGWLSEDQQYFYLDDELDESNRGINTTTHVIDVSDLTNAIQVSTFSSGSTAIDHNQYVRGNRIYQANYRSGLRVFDATSPTNPVQIGYFDTYPTDDNANFNGMWSNYPFLPSGNIICSDIERGLFVLSMNPSLLAFNYPDGQPDMISPSGGTTMRVQVLADGGDPEPDTGILHVDRGDGFEQFPMADLGNDLYLATFPSAACGSDVQWYVSAETIDGDPYSDPRNAPNAFYTAMVASGIEVTFADNFEGDLGWTVQNVDLTDGAWERGIPSGNGSRGDPTSDYDGSGRCYVTGNGGVADVDGGPTMLLSPIFDLANLSQATISYARWFSNDDNDEDRLDVEISNNGGSTWTLVESVGNTGGWTTYSFTVSDVITPTSQMRLRFSATDNPNNSVTEAALDAVEIGVIQCGDITTELISYTLLFGAEVDGDIDSLRLSDDNYLRINSQFGFLSSEPNVMEMQLLFETDATSPNTVDVTIESRINNPNGTARVRVKNHNTGLFDLVDVYPINQTESVRAITGLDAADYVNLANNGAIRVKLKQVVVATFSVQGFQTRLDQIAVDVD
ncbi:MAG: choice-of-anchor B family protein [Phycisphaerales bacterium]